MKTIIHYLNEQRDLFEEFHERKALLGVKSATQDIFYGGALIISVIVSVQTRRLEEKNKGRSVQKAADLKAEKLELISGAIGKRE